MKRPAATVDTLNRIKIWREICPEITIRSTFIVGFPGETDDDFRQLLDFIEQAELDRVGCFQYSAVEGAAANAYEDHVSAEVSESRWHTFMQTQAIISKNKLQAKVGLELDVIIDHVDNEGMVGRSKGDAPEIDGNVIMPLMKECKIGDIVNVQIERSDEYDLWGKMTGMQKDDN